MPSRKKTSRSSKQGGFARQMNIRTLILCIVIGVFLFVPALFVNTPIGYIPILTYVFATALSYAYVRVLKERLEFETKGVSGDCLRKEEVAFALRISNGSFLPAMRLQAHFFMSDIFGGEGFTNVHSIALGPNDSKDFDFSIRFDHIGTYHVGVKRVVVSDLLGIFSYVRENDRLAEVNVQPRVFDVDSLPIERDAAVESKHNFSTVINDGMDYAGVREYVWGDAIKAIHWKLSAQLTEGDYYTRLYETNANPGMAIVADFDAPVYPVEELMSIYDAVVECSFSLMRFAEMNDFDAELLFQDKSKESRRYFTPLSDKRQEVLDGMPQIFSPGTGVEALALIREEVKSVFAQSNLIVCTSVISKELIETLIASRNGKRVPVLFAIIPSGASEERVAEIQKLLKRAGAAGVNYTVISSAGDLPGATDAEGEAK